MKKILVLTLLCRSAFGAPPGASDQLNDSSPAALSEGDYAGGRLTPQRGKHVNLRNQAGTEIGTSTTPVRIDPTGTTSQPVLVTDGTNTSSVKAASTVPVATDQALVVVQSPNGNHATAANQSTAITALQLIDNPVGSVTGGTAGSSSYLSGGVYNSSAPALTNGQQAAMQLDASGNLRIVSVPSDGAKLTYSAAASGFAPAALATDVFTIIGSATKSVKVLRVSISGTTTSGSGVTVNLAIVKRSSADTAGTSSVITNVVHDSNDAAATAVVRSYTANPTLGTTVGSVRTARFAFPTAGLLESTGVSSEYEFGFGPEKAITLRGVAEQLVINLGATTITGGILSAYVEWTEE